tara:strand:+ start:5443 stop:6900 length:1458 start_codon:yes stop_codon:yes gene_type:complete
MKTNIIDKAIGYFNPKYAYRASIFRSASKIFGDTGIYDGATQSNHYNNSDGTTPNEDTDELETLRDNSRNLYKNNGFIEGLVNSATDHVIGDGLEAKSTIDRMALGVTDERAIEIENILDRYFNSWAESTIADTTAKDNFYLMQRLIYETYLVDGDCFATLPLRNINQFNKILQLDLIGSEDVDSMNPQFIEGIKVSKEKMPLEYSIIQSDGTYKTFKAFKGGKRNVLHLFKRKRIKTVRGIPFATSIMKDAVYINSYMTHELAAAKLSAIFFGSIKSAAKDGILGNGQVDVLTGKQTQTTKNTVKENAITELNPGDELNIHPAGRDNPNIEQFVMTCLKKFSSAKRIPLEIILGQFVSSYSASRAAMISMQKFVNPERALFTNSICNPIRNQVLTWGMLQGELNIPEFWENRTEILKCRWIGDPVMSVDPVKDAKAKILMIDNFLLDYEKATLDLGNGDFTVNVNNLKKQKALLGDLIEKEEIL